MLHYQTSGWEAGDRRWFSSGEPANEGSPIILDGLFEHINLCDLHSSTYLENIGHEMSKIACQLTD